MSGDEAAPQLLLAPPRYVVFATVRGSETRIGETDDMTLANRMMLEALVAGAEYARQAERGHAAAKHACHA